MLVSDRAKGLIKLGDADYFDVCSMPDLFHFNQELAQTVGAPIGKAWKKAKGLLKAAKASAGLHFERKELEDNYLSLDVCRRRYQNGMHDIHKAVQPYNEDGSFTKEEVMRKAIITSLSLIEKQAIQIEKEVKTKKVIKVVDQIPELLSGVQQWQNWTVERATLFVKEIGIDIREEELQKWLIHYLLPVFIWQLTLKRVPTKKKNERLIIHYKEVLQKARDKLKGSKLENYMTVEQYEQCKKWAERIARTFQRSSSQVEGRNGYLAFIHKASRGLTNQRLKTLTVVHNFDTIGWDGKTPAERLFDREFPNLFEFVLENVTAFPEPRKRKHKRLINNTVRA